MVRRGGRTRRSGDMMATLVCLGLGYCARHYVAEFGRRFDRIVGSTRTMENAQSIGSERYGGCAVEMHVFDGKAAPRALAGAIADAQALLISAGPSERGDPVLAHFQADILRAPKLSAAVLLSTLSVYPDSNGAWIDESREVIPGRGR